MANVICRGGFAPNFSINTHLLLFISGNGIPPQDNPLKFYTLLAPQNVITTNKGEETVITISSLESHSIIASFRKSYTQSNSFSTSAEISGGYGPISASLSIDFGLEATSESETGGSEETGMEKSIQGKYTIKGKNGMYFVLAEMKLVVYKVQEKLEHIIIPTGIAIVVQDKRESVLRDGRLFDDSLAALPRNMGIKYYTLEQLVESVKTESIETYTGPLRFPKDGVFYKIKNRNQPFTWLKRWYNHVTGCGKWDDVYSGYISKKPDNDRSDELWKFERHDGHFLIINKRYPDRRLVEYPLKKGQTMGTYAERDDQLHAGTDGGRIDRKELFDVFILGEGNQVKLKVVDTGRWLSMWGEWTVPKDWYSMRSHYLCGFDANPENDDNIWILEPENA